MCDWNWMKRSEVLTQIPKTMACSMFTRKTIVMLNALTLSDVCRMKLRFSYMNEYIRASPPQKSVCVLKRRMWLSAFGTVSGNSFFCANCYQRTYACSQEQLFSIVTMSFPSCTKSVTFSSAKLVRAVPSS